jgi:predicted peptidase
VQFGSPSLAGDAGSQKPGRLEAKVPVTLDYLNYLPKDYDSKPSWPLLVFLHGAGERGSDLELVKKHGPPKLIEAGKDFPMIVVSPQCPKDRWWTTELQTLSALVDDIESKYHVDRDREYLSGLSMGGFGTWSLAAYTPDRFAAIVPICGGGEAMAARRLTKMPTWAFHGGKDGVVPLKRSEDMVSALKHSGGDVKLTVYPEAGHDSWSETYDNPEVYAWLLQHSRKPSASKP